VTLANTKVKTLTKNKKKEQQKQNSKNKQVKLSSRVTSHADAQDQEQLSGYDSYYKQLSEEVESIERHVRELRQTPGLEHLTEADAEAQVDFMLRFSAWVFNQHLTEELIATIDDIAATSAKDSNVQKPKAKSNKKVTESLSR
jgi:L-ribulose-5-phosphate 3-epimerase UlaE